MFSFSYRILAITKLKKKLNITTTKNYFIFITIQRWESKRRKKMKNYK